MQKEEQNPTVEVASAIVKDLYPNATIKVFAEKKSYDNHIFLVNIEENDSNTKIVVRFPTSDSKHRIYAHQPVQQAWISNQWLTKQLPVPKPIKIDDEYLVESFIPGKSLEDIPTEKRSSSFQEMGSLCKSMHTISTKNYGPFVSPALAQYSSWKEFLENFFLKRFELIIKNKTFPEELINQIQLIWNENIVYLENFSSPKLLHGDLNGDNIHVESDENDLLHICGFFDFCDALSGDPLFEIGAMFEAMSKHWNELFEKLGRGYCENEAFSLEEKNQIIRYALYTTVFYLCEDMEVRESRIVRYQAKCENLIRLMQTQ